MHSGFLKKLFERVTNHVKEIVGTFDEKELKLYSHTLVKFVDTLTREPQTRTKREQLISVLRKELYNSVNYPSRKPLNQLQRVSGLSLVAFGSSVTGTGLRDGDLDISVDGMYRYKKLAKTVPLSEANREIQALLLTDLMRFLKERHRIYYQGETFILSRARVPILRYTDKQFGIQCDISIGNRDSVERSEVLARLFQTDPRIRLLIVLMKKWAKMHGLNDASRGSFGSYALTVFVLAFCSEKGVLDLVWSSSTPQDSIKCREALYNGSKPKIVVCCRNGAVMDDNGDFKFGKSPLFVRDPFTTNNNCAKPVTLGMLHQASRVLQLNLETISAFLECPSDERMQRWQLLFQSLFQTKVKFKKQLAFAGPSEKNEVQEKGALFGIHEELIDGYLQLHRTKKVRIYTNAFANWFLIELQKRYVDSDSNQTSNQTDKSLRQSFGV